MDLKLDKDMLDLPQEVEEELKNLEPNEKLNSIEPKLTDTTKYYYNTEKKAFIKKWEKKLIDSVKGVQFSLYNKTPKIKRMRIDEYNSTELYIDNDEPLHRFPQLDDNDSYKITATESIINWLINSQDCRVKGLVFDINEDEKKCELVNVLLFKRNLNVENCLDRKGVWDNYDLDDVACKIRKKINFEAVSKFSSLFRKTIGLIQRDWSSDCSTFFDNFTKIPENAINFDIPKKDILLTQLPLLNTRIGLFFQSFITVNEAIELLNNGYKIKPLNRTYYSNGSTIDDFDNILEYVNSKNN